MKRTLCHLNLSARFPMLLFWILILCSPSCGGGDNGEGGQSGTTELQVEQVVDKLKSTFGEDGGFDAVILSIDKGYSLEQIVDAIMSERLEGNGDIENGAGSIEAPVNPPLNMIIVGLARSKMSGAATYPLSQLRALAKEMEIALSKSKELVLLLLQGRGYTGEQIFEGILLKTIKLKVRPWQTDYFGRQIVTLVIVKPGEYPVFTGDWHSAGRCDDLFYPWRWGIDLLASEIAETVTGHIDFHRCPGEGKVRYSVSGTLILEILRPGKPASDLFSSEVWGPVENDEFVLLTPTLVDGAGPLYDNPPNVPILVVWYGKAPWPNLAP